MDVLIIILLIIIIIILLFSDKFCGDSINEHLDATLSNEAIKNIASVYNTDMLTVSGLTITGNKFNLLPKGIVVAYSGSPVPVGWLMCDGQNGTPDLRSRFIFGAGWGTALNSTGGSATHTLTIDEMPSHNHIGPKVRGLDKVAGGSGIDDSTGYVGYGAYTSSTGGSKPHNNMPPFYALYYIMKS